MYCGDMLTYISVDKSSSYISAKNGPKRKANISIELKASNVTIRFDLGHDLDLEFSRSNMELAMSQLEMVQMSRNEKQRYRLNSRWQLVVPWHWIFKVKYVIRFILWQNYLIAKKRKMNMLIED